MKKFTTLVFLILFAKFSLSATLQCSSPGWPRNQTYVINQTSGLDEWDGAQKIEYILQKTVAGYPYQTLTANEINWNYNNTWLYYHHFMSGVADKAPMLSVSAGHMFCSGIGNQPCTAGRYDMPRNRKRSFELNFFIAQDIVGNLRLHVKTNEGGSNEYFILSAPGIVTLGKEITIPDSVKLDDVTNQTDGSYFKQILVNNSGYDLMLNSSTPYGWDVSEGKGEVMIYPGKNANDQVPSSNVRIYNGENLFINLKVKGGAKSGEYKQMLNVKLSCP